jgi:SAM-dependent methyltransferase
MTGLKFELFNKSEIEKIELPYIVFQDLDFGQKIPYGDNKFDLIYSQDTIPYIRYSIELFNEILRVLKPKGMSIHTDVTGINIYDHGILLDFKDALIELRKAGFDITLLDNPNSLRFKKKGQDQPPFPLIPHTPIPANIENLSIEQRHPEMGYNLSF